MKKKSKKKIKISISKKMKSLREEKGITLTKLSRQSGVQLATLSRIENDVMTGTLEVHAKIAITLGVELSDLYKNIRFFKDTARNTSILG